VEPVGASLLAKVANDNAFILTGRVIVNEFREQARSYKDQDLERRAIIAAHVLTRPVFFQLP
jgi:hypothetical protein